MQTEAVAYVFEWRAMVEYGVYVTAGAKRLVMADDSVKIITYANRITDGLGIPFENWIPD